MCTYMYVSGDDTLVAPGSGDIPFSVPCPVWGSPVKETRRHGSQCSGGIEVVRGCRVGYTKRCSGDCVCSAWRREGEEKVLFLPSPRTGEFRDSSQECTGTGQEPLDTRRSIGNSNQI